MNMGGGRRPVGRAQRNLFVQRAETTDFRFDFIETSLKLTIQLFLLHDVVRGYRIGVSREIPQPCKAPTHLVPVKRPLSFSG